jgi:tRNA (guanine37-N1)-methyltransferase
LIFSVISIFPEMFAAVSQFGISKRALDKKIYELLTLNPRDFTSDPYKRIDDKSFGGGSAMVMKIEPLELALNEAVNTQKQLGVTKPVKVYLSPQGKTINQQMVNNLSLEQGIILVCGRYEGVDERFIERNIDLEISVADIVVSGGELPGMLLIDAIVRQLPGALNSPESAINDSFMNGLLDYPHYTKPREHEGATVPDVLLSGDHKQIMNWRLQESLKRTLLRRPDLLKTLNLNKVESRLLEKIKQEQDLRKK